MGQLNGKVVMITGTGKGLGRQTAIRMGQEGARLAISDLLPEKLAETARLCEETGAEVLPVVCDVSREDDLRTYVSTTVERFGRIDTLVNNANYQTEQQPFLEQDLSSLRKALDVGLFAQWNLMKLCHPHLKRTNGATSSIVNFVSGVYETGVAGYASYVPDKAAIRGLSMVVAREWGADGIRVNTVAPYALTDTILSDLSPEYSTVVTEAMAQGPLGRVGDPARDIAPVVVFLASDASGWLTGQNLNADGGEIIHI